MPAETYVLEVIGGQHVGAKYPMLGDSISIGRERTNIVCLEDVGVSRRHARVFRDGANWAIEDLDSRNGILVAGQKVVRQPLNLRDEIMIGQAKLRFMTETLAEAEPPPARPQPKPSERKPAASFPADGTSAMAPAVEMVAPASVPAVVAPASVPAGRDAGPAAAAPKPAPAPAPAPRPAPAPVAPPQPRPKAPVVIVPETDAQAIEFLHQASGRIKGELSKVIIGQTEIVEQVLISMFCRGHCLLVGVPGLAKTLMVRTLGQILDLDFKRIQFTPDLMPSDITGTQILEEDPATHQRTLRFVRGPIFTNILLADEINRTPPKTQAALLEAMQEGRVTAGGTSYQLSQPFLVLATQNPIEQEGTYPLPEAQLDRFMFMIKISYPARQDEIEIYRATTQDSEPSVEAALSGEVIMKLQRLIRRVPVSDHVTTYTADLVRATRPDTADAPEFVKEWLTWGAGPRAGQYLLLSAKARAVLAGRMNVSCEDIKNSALPVLRHRIFCNFNAASQGVDADKVVTQLLEHVPQPTEKNYK